MAEKLKQLQAAVCHLFQSSNRQRGAFLLLRQFYPSYSDNMQVPPFEVENVLLVLPSSSSAGQVPAPTLVAHLDELSAMKQPLAWG